MTDSKERQKREYLRQAIIEGGHNPDKFAQYLASVKGEDDVGKWTLDELKAEVDNFACKNSEAALPQKQSEDAKARDIDEASEIADEAKPIKAKDISLFVSDSLERLKDRVLGKSAKAETRKEVPMLKVKPPDDLKSVLIREESPQPEANETALRNNSGNVRLLTYA